MATNDVNDDNDNNDDEFDPQMTEQRQRNMLRLLSFLLQRFADERGVAREHYHTIEPKSLLAWLRDMDGSDKAATLREDSGIDDDEVHDVLASLLHSSAGQLLIAHIWTSVLLFDRSLPSVPVRQVVVNFVIHFEDDTTLLVNSSVPAVAVSSPITDALLCTILSEVSGSLQKIICSTPLDELRAAKAIDNGGINGYQVFMGASLKALHTLPEPHRRNALAWFRIMQQLAMPVLPPQLLQALQSRRDAFQQAQAAEEAGRQQAEQAKQTGEICVPPMLKPPPQSGWDDA